MPCSHAAPIERCTAPGLQTITLPRKGCAEHFITAVPVGDESASAVFGKTAEAVRDRDAQIISVDVFGVPDRNGTGLRALRDALGDLDWPLTWIEEGGDGGLCGAQVWAVSGVAVKPVFLNERIIGSFFEDACARYCRLGGVAPTDASRTRTERTRTEQAREVFENLERALGQVGMDFSHAPRTWFYNDDILAWYADFNEVRNDFFTERGVYEGLVPASTGIGARNPFGAALVAGLLAVDPKEEGLRSFAVPSPLQGAALEYGSSFSRAVELVAPDLRRLFVSGTASIEPSGETAHVGDMAGQVDLTMRVVGAILDARRMSWADVTRGVAYVRNPADAPALSRYCSAQGLPAMPVVVTTSVVCRDDLLFEIEVDAVRKD
ncbi:MAG TPA: RidA family protein [Sumerlaeia bacterium]|nr:RidA family protein [Sumerlaeia bacterium]